MSTHKSVCFCLCLGLLVVPVLEILGNRCALSILVLLQHGREASVCLGRLLMHDILKSHVLGKSTIILWRDHVLNDLIFFDGKYFVGSPK